MVCPGNCQACRQRFLWRRWQSSWRPFRSVHILLSLNISFYQWNSSNRHKLILTIFFNCPHWKFSQYSQGSNFGQNDISVSDNFRRIIKIWQQDEVFVAPVVCIFCPGSVKGVDLHTISTQYLQWQGRKKRARCAIWKVERIPYNLQSN